MKLSSFYILFYSIFSNIRVNFSSNLFKNDQLFNNFKGI